ncbi:RNA methyltransferase [Desulfuromonas thiophila]|uniref:RNA methyltransferase n=1 Tax=Desulfuromonas thiophila TaxID=57664 RepID=UPI0024A8273B|nr:RNA methyltransferase [Desulfuromonas thiophila]
MSDLAGSVVAPLPLVVVLVEPQGPLNIGSICRAMGNFGFQDLRLVRPQTDHLGEQARLMAVKAAPLLERARVCTSLAEALADCHYAIGTTRRFGRYREDFIHPRDAAGQLVELGAVAPVALVFGREDRGLLTEELDLCQRLLTIPTRDALPSMNLAQAVSLCLYEVSCAQHAAAAAPAGGRKLAGSDQVEAMFDHMRRSLLAIGYLDPQNPDHILRGYRRMLGRSGLSPRDVRILQGLWSKLDWLAGQAGLAPADTEENNT